MIDDGSTDDTAARAGKYSDGRIKLVVGATSLGLAARLNEAIDLASGELFARMDGDDVSYPLRLERQVEYLDHHQRVDLIGSAVLVFGRDGVAVGKRAAPALHATMVGRPEGGFPIAHPTLLGRIQFFRRFRYRAEAIRCEDQDLLLRSYRHATFGNVPDILLGYREEELDLRKLLTARRYFASAVWRQLAANGEHLAGVRGVALQLAKGSLDVLAVATRLDHKLLRQRARPLSEAEVSEWDRLWTSVQLAAPELD